ncbi:hypothetical protein MT325_m202L [Paramecium bursaria chlorella virus MT325]|uniref:Uncharacterized protein m202L n=1 Tax=Paramecium bursaria Chlorella virus MT325 TaxID=346932 RepID=A7ITT2_PBCVM|nr:hypothetical protein MT325_m202L [Paramecium bursaria chlorella virus MT325]
MVRFIQYQRSKTIKRIVLPAKKCLDHTYDKISRSVANGSSDPRYCRVWNKAIDAFFKLLCQKLLVNQNKRFYSKCCRRVYATNCLAISSI